MAEVLALNRKKKTGINPREIKKQQIGNELCHILERRSQSGDGLKQQIYTRTHTSAQSLGNVTLLDLVQTERMSHRQLR